jgi:hypothetical protein
MRGSHEILKNIVGQIKHQEDLKFEKKMRVRMTFKVFSLLSVFGREICSV